MNDTTDSKRFRLLIISAATIAGIVALYFSVYGLIVLDELVFKTFVYSKHLPEGVQDFLKLIYRPFIPGPPIP